MYRVLLADDEGIMLYSLQTIIMNTFGDECEIATAKTGTSALELSEEFRPDIIFMDIRMPGMTGIEVMQAVREKNDKVLFIVLTAYDKFDYAKEALSLGAFEFLTKPVGKNAIIEVMTKAMRQVDQNNQVRIDNRRMREKLETVIPVIESGFISSIIMQDEDHEGEAHYLELLDMREKYGYMVQIRFGEQRDKGVLTNPVGMSMRAQKFYPEMKDVLRDHLHCVVGPVMGNRVLVAVLCERKQENYEERIHTIEQIRAIIGELERRIDARFRVGIGQTVPIEQLWRSYQDTQKALRGSKGHIVHANDVMHGRVYTGGYPDDVENALFDAAKTGDVNTARNHANLFFDWMEEKHSDDLSDIRTKCLEFVLRAEYLAFSQGATSYDFSFRKNYLDEMLGCGDNMLKLRKWFTEKITQATRLIEQGTSAQSDTIVEKTKHYIGEHYAEDISLDLVSRMVNVSPYYFSKLFKEEAGITFIDYLISVRIDKAKEYLANESLSIKEVCRMAGYSDPNYFSRIFKKQESVTPSEYREKMRK